MNSIESQNVLVCPVPGRFEGLSATKLQICVILWQVLGTLSCKIWYNKGMLLTGNFRHRLILINVIVVLEDIL